jgi:hypothetical protein
MASVLSFLGRHLFGSSSFRRSVSDPIIHSWAHQAATPSEWQNFTLPSTYRLLLILFADESPELHRLRDHWRFMVYSLDSIELGI